MPEGAQHNKCDQPHEDGPAYHPVVAILSLGAPAVLRFRRKSQQHEAGAAEAESVRIRGSSSGAAAAASPSPTPPALAASLLLAPRSLVVFRDQAFTDCLHSIDEVQEEVLDGSVANLALCGAEEGAVLPRGGERISLTVRRVARVLPSLLRPRGT
ncbi:putative alpha-ketoglutarate-dependent dioxygenase ABH6 [Tetrabaena socialis]|uniref:Putative alpha-ketoglutarate-dependent dioxygenase ABH6 n=1 Tax=Tetrabaena socialis TaxID=47790 RepID=A0A2J7ZUW0_9CHLO|nr:putative alpha-ketoglutarate-dependent dioxygenase ABH6 [Tetrabaena socialis]|eukprot:PNH04054.1 putative alpha-ketoglutarate-dependent dioxygenase ABH6 [Tetrabaena socialis]